MSRLVVTLPPDMSRADESDMQTWLGEHIQEGEAWRTVVISAGCTITDLDVPSVVTDEDVERIAARVVALLKEQPNA